MKRFAILALVFVAADIAEEAAIKQSASSLESEYEAFKMCVVHARITEAEIQIIHQQLEKIQNNSIDDETKNIPEKYKRFQTCMLETLDLMKNSKLIVDKIITNIEMNKNELHVNADIVKKCLNALNDDNKIIRKDRAIGVSICIQISKENKNKKKEEECTCATSHLSDLEIAGDDKRWSNEQNSIEI